MNYLPLLELILISAARNFVVVQSVPTTCYFSLVCVISFRHGFAFSAIFAST